MIYGYARCSTNELKQDIDRQKRELKNMGAEKIYFEYQSGTKKDREELQNLLEVIKKGDTIVTTEVSRLSRSTKHLCEIIELCKEKKIKLVIQNSITVDCSKGELDPMTNAFLQISGVFAELEREMTVQRIKSGMANAAAKGTHCGRPRYTAKEIPQQFKKYYEQYKQGSLTKTELSKLTGYSRPTVYSYLNILEGEGL